MRQTAPLLGPALLVLIGAALIWNTVPARAQADGPPDNSIDPPTSNDLPSPAPSWGAASGAQLDCGVRPARVGVDGASVAAFTCWVTGAPEGDTRVILEALRLVDEQGSTRPITVVGPEGTLSGGSGLVTGTLIDPVGAPMVGGMQIRGMLLPSGLSLGPVQIAPTLL